MLTPVTDLAKKFNEQCLQLADGLRDSGTGLGPAGRPDQISRPIQTFFESIQHLPATIAPLDSRATVLFEIDRSLSGTYGAKVFTPAESVTPTRKLLRDLAAMWQRYFLMADLTRSEAINGTITGTMSFYEEWLKVENVGIDQSEYDRIIADVTLMLQSSENLNVAAKVVLFSLTGKILITLGVSEEFAQSRLQSHLEYIKERNVDTTSPAVAEILICLQVIHARGRGMDASGIPDVVLQKTLRFLSARDELFDNLFKAWGWRRDIDYTSPLAMGDQIFLKERSSLFMSWANATARLGIGHSFLELADHKKKNPNLMSIFQPIPIFMFGNSGVGKSTYLTALAYDAQMRGGKSLTLGRELQAAYENTVDSWKGGMIAPTRGFQTYSFWENLNITSFSTVDYGGQETQPDQWEQQLQELFRSARGLIFFLSDEDYSDPNKLRRRANWFDAILQYWTQSNPHIRHVPIALILTKCDMVFGEALGELKRSSLVPPSLQPALIETLLPQRLPREMKELGSPFGRLRDSILRDHNNNYHPILQDVVQNVLDNFSQFFNRVLDLTYHYQVFLTSSMPPRMVNDPLFPWGVKEPMMWMLNILETFHLRESLAKFKNEEQQIENELRNMHEDIAQMQRYKEEIASATAEITRLRQKPTLFQVTMKDRIKYHEENKTRAEQDFNTIFQRYVKDSPDMNKVAGLQAVERVVRSKEDLMKGLREKRSDFEARLKGR